MKKFILCIFTVLLSVVSFAKEKIVVYTPSSMNYLQKELGDDFYKKTGVEVEFVGIKGINARIKLEKRNPKADVVLGLSKADFLQAKKDDLFVSYKPKNASNIVRSEYLMDKDWYITPMDFGSLAINANKDGLEKMPTSFEDLTKLKGLLINLDPNSSTGKNFMLWTIAVYGDKWLDFWKALKPAIKTTAPGWTEGWAKFTANEAPLMVGYATSDLYFEEGSSYKSFIPKEGGFIYKEGASIIAKKKVKDGAKLFVDYILEDKFQKLMADKNYMLPVTNVKLDDSFKKVPTSDKIVTVKDEDFAKVEKYTKELTRLLKK